MCKKKHKSKPRTRTARQNNMYKDTMDVVKLGVGATVGVGVLGMVKGAISTT